MKRPVATRTVLSVLVLLLTSLGIIATIVKHPTNLLQHAAPVANHHYFYVATEGSIAVYDMDNNFTQLQTISLPQTAGHGIRGIAANPASHLLYISYGGDGDGNGNGSLLAYDLINNQVVWTKSYSHGIDSMAITPDGKTIYMPDGELTNDGKWYIVDATTGNETGAVIDTGSGTGDNGPHNTAIGANGNFVYMGDRNDVRNGSNYFYVASTKTNQITQKVGPFASGIRPFTVNSDNTLVYTSITGLLGFQVGDLTTGKVLYTVNLNKPSGANCSNGGETDPSHGITLSPDEKELYVIDYPCNYVHVFDIANVPESAPTQIAAIPVHSFNQNQSPCSYDCLGDGWLLTSSDGKYVFVGDSGDVIDTTTQTVVTHINNLYQSRIFIEVDWQGTTPVFTTTRVGLGYSSTSGGSPTGVEPSLITPTVYCIGSCPTNSQTPNQVATPSVSSSPSTQPSGNNNSTVSQSPCLSPTPTPTPGKGHGSKHKQAKNGLLRKLMQHLLKVIIKLFQYLEGLLGKNAANKSVLSITTVSTPCNPSSTPSSIPVSPSSFLSPTNATAPSPTLSTTAKSFPANIDYEGISNYGNYNPSALTNPNVGAVDISMNWSQVEPQQGIFNFTPADKVMADWSTQGKKFTIIVRFANEAGNCSSNQFTPSWELAKIPSFCDTDYGDIVPDYFSPTFKADWVAFVKAIGIHIAQSPYKNNLLYIRIAVGLGAEGFPLSQKGDYLTVDKPKLAQWGYTPTVWAAWQEEMLTAYKNALPSPMIIYPLNGLDTDPATDKPVQVEVAEWAAARGFGLGQQGLEPGTNAPLFQQLRIQYPQIYIQYGTVNALTRSMHGSCPLTCVAQADIQASEHNGAQFVEWYSQDITNPLLQPYFAQWQQFVNSTY